VGNYAPVEIHGLRLTSGIRIFSLTYTLFTSWRRGFMLNGVTAQLGEPTRISVLLVKVHESRDRIHPFKLTPFCYSNEHRSYSVTCSNFLTVLLVCI